MSAPCWPNHRWSASVETEDRYHWEQLDIYCCIWQERSCMRGSTWLLRVSKPWSDHIKLSTYKYSGSPEGSLDFIRRIYRTHPTSASPIATREKHNAFPHCLPSVAPKPNLNSCLYPRLLLPLELHRIKSCLLLWLRRFYTNKVSGKCAKTATQGFHVVVRA